MKTVVVSSLIVLFIVGAANAATVPINDPLTGYTGSNADGSPNPLGSTEDSETVAQLAANGLEPQFIWGGGNNIPDPGGWDSWERVLFDTSGATFGVGQAANYGRNLIRTIEADYNTASFAAYITVVNLDPSAQNVFFGLGAGSRGRWGAPEIDLSGGGTDGTFFEIKGATFTSWIADDGYFEWGDLVEGAGPGIGTHRFKMAYDATAQTVVFSYDANYDGTFVEDLALPAVDVSGLFTDGEPTKIYFGADDGGLLKDFAVVPEPATMTLLGLGLLGLIKRRR